MYSYVIEMLSSIDEANIGIEQITINLIIIPNRFAYCITLFCGLISPLGYTYLGSYQMASMLD